MKMIPVDDIPEVVRCRHDLRDFLKGFVNGEDSIVKIDFTEHDYKNVKSCYECLWSGAKLHGYNIKVMKRGDEVYLMKKM